jgi:hypothetical protein
MLASRLHLSTSLPLYLFTSLPRTGGNGSHDCLLSRGILKERLNAHMFIVRELPEATVIAGGQYFQTTHRSARHAAFARPLL